MNVRGTPWRLLAGIALASLFCGCGQPTLRELPRGATVVAFGDSLTFGTGAGRGQGYPQVLAARTGLRVINAGVPGEVTGEGLQRLPGVLTACAPSLLILCHGGNDLLRGVDDRAIADNLSAMVALARKRKIDVLLIAVPRPGLLLTPPAFYEQVAAEHRVPCDTVTLPRVMGTPAMMGDDVHPNGRGYAELAQALANRVQVRPN